MTARNPWRPTRRRLTDTLNSALAPIAACSLALGGLTTWVTAGRAGDPPRITVSPGRVLLSYGDSTRTAVFFDIANTGDADDRLLRVTSAETGGDLELSRHVMTGKAAASRETVTSVAVRAGRRLSMSPQDLAVTLRPGAGWREGELVAFTLHFEHTGAVRTLALVVRPGSRSRAVTGVGESAP
ncbi:copper chaperone PCu(A)C [Streptomyces sp. NPDC057280]|uniref:copper chaperone PCu(A)C n=1 Tax=Streptomyces sp. NPDC057280 TaxID=3346081 RepID=UPI00363B74F8